MSRGPLPSQLCLLSQLPERAVGDKVRFLGCVLAYSTEKGSLQLAHAYPKDSTVTAIVDVGLVLNSLGEEQTRIGEWVNVLGYVTAKPRVSASEPVSVHVQALMIWSTGPLELHRYESTLENMKTTGKK